MEIQIDSRIAEALNSSSMISSILNKLIICIAQKGRSHLLLRDKEEEKTIKGLKKVIETNWKKFNQVWEENDYLKAEIERLGNEPDEKRNNAWLDDKNRELLSELYENEVIDEDGNIIQYNKE